MKTKQHSRVAVIVICCVLAFLIVATIRLQIKLNELREQMELLEKESNAARIEVERLEEENASYGTDEYMEKSAKDRLDYNNAGDIIYHNDISD